MARSHGKILIEIWHDPDWRALSPLDQWTYFMLLSQPKLNLVGCIDYRPARWATLSDEATPAEVTASLDRLEQARYVCIDHETEELLVRSMTRHDGLRTQNPKLMKGLWGQWLGIASANLRKVAVDNMPDTLFEGEVPVEAQRFRRSARMDWPIDAQSDAQSDLLPPSTNHRPTTTVAQSVPRPDLPVDNPKVQGLAARALARAHQPPTLTVVDDPATGATA